MVTGGRTGAPLKEEPQHFFFLLQNLKNKIRTESRERIFPACLSQYVPCPAPIQGVGSCLLQFVVKLLSNQGCVARSLFSSLPVLGTSLAFAIIKQSSHIFFFFKKKILDPLTSSFLKAIPTSRCSFELGVTPCQFCPAFTTPLLMERCKSPGGHH